MVMYYSVWVDMAIDRKLKCRIYLEGNLYIPISGTVESVANDRTVIPDHAYILLHIDPSCSEADYEPFIEILHERHCQFLSIFKGLESKLQVPSFA